jgi:hypothetical protein
LECAPAVGNVKALMEPPHFLCIGAHKSGTTWLYENLKRHPAVWLPPVKELHYFDGMPGLPKVAQRFNEAIKEVVATGRVTDPAKLDHMRKVVLDQPKDFAWYRSLFGPAGERLTGDMTPAYSTLPPPVVGKIRELLPDCRVIFIMRNPIERAWSHFRSNAEKAKLDIAAVGLDVIRRQVDSPSSQLRTGYTRTIETWEQCFPRDRILYLFYDDLLADRDSFLAAVCRFLGLSFEGHYFADTRDAVVNRSMVLEIDPSARAYLARKYHKEIAALQRRFGGHTDRWLEDCERLIADGKS